MAEGKEAAQSQSYGPEARGGASKAEVIIDTETIYHPHVTRPDLVLAMTQKAADKYYREGHEKFADAVLSAIGEKEVPMATMDESTERMTVITLCGSTRFKEQFLEQQKRLTLEGNVVISVGLFGHSADEEVWKPGMKEMLDKMHFQKIDMADEIFVINVGGYIGESTKREIAYAKSKGKIINYLEE